MEETLILISVSCRHVCTHCTGYEFGQVVCIGGDITCIVIILCKVGQVWHQLWWW